MGTIKGRPSVAPCGHRGEIVIGTFSRCIEGCRDDAVPPHIETESTDRIKASASCPYCGSREVRFFAHAFMSMDTMACDDCGKLFR
jgi:hypothetical protein